MSVSKSGVFKFLQITQDQNKIKKTPNTILQTSVSGKRAKFQQKIFNYMVVVARQSFQFFRQNL